jgi:hypothetical protein
MPNQPRSSIRLRGSPVTISSSRRFGLLLTIAALCGCEKQQPPLPVPVDTGAEAVARSFFDAMVREDWNAAYDTIDAESRARVTKEQFASRAQANMKRVGFKPTEVGVAVSETGDRASAVAVYRSVSEISSKRYKDGTALKRSGQGWAVALRSNFGNQAAMPPGKVKPRGNG